MQNSEELLVIPRPTEARQRELIFVIDDSPDMLLLQRTVLELEGYEVSTAQSAMEALEILADIDNKPALILLDVHMEDMSGYEFLNMLEEKRPDIIENVPVVLLTGMDEVQKSRAVKVIRKATDLEQFLEAVHCAIEMGHHSPYKH